MNHEFVLGPINHYRGITDEQAAALGINRLPKDRFGSAIVLDGVSARRLRNGLLNVAIPADSRLLQDKRFGPFLQSLVGPDSSYETSPPPLAVITPPPGPAGQWSIDIESRRVAWSDRVFELHGVERGTSHIDVVDDALRIIHRDDRGRIADAINDAIYGSSDLNETYRVIVDGTVRHLRAIGRRLGPTPGLASGRVSGVVHEEAAGKARRGR